MTKIYLNIFYVNVLWLPTVYCFYSILSSSPSSHPEFHILFINIYCCLYHCSSCQAKVRQCESARWNKKSNIIWINKYYKYDKYETTSWQAIFMRSKTLSLHVLSHTLFQISFTINIYIYIHIFEIHIISSSYSIRTMWIPCDIQCATTHPVFKMNKYNNIYYACVDACWSKASKEKTGRFAVIIVTMMIIMCINILWTFLAGDVLRASIVAKRRGAKSDETAAAAVKSKGLLTLWDTDVTPSHAHLVLGANSQNTRSIVATWEGGRDLCWWWRH